MLTHHASLMKLQPSYTEPHHGNSMSLAGNPIPIFSVNSFSISCSECGPMTQRISFCSKDHELAEQNIGRVRMRSVPEDEGRKGNRTQLPGLCPNPLRKITYLNRRTTCFLPYTSLINFCDNTTYYIRYIHAGIMSYLSIFACASKLNYFQIFQSLHINS